MLAAKLLSGIGGEEKLFVDDVFSAHTYLGNGSTQTINNWIDLAGKGGLTWIKGRNATTDHHLYDTVRGGGYKLSSNTTDQSSSGSGAITFSSSGFSLDDGGGNTNNTLTTYISHTFCNAPKFFTHSQVTKSAGSNATVDLSTLGTVGMVKVKRTDSTGSWYVWHRSLSAGKLLIGETTAAEATLGHITVVGTTLTLVNGVIADGTYHVEAYAHDTSADGLIQCGSFTTGGSGNATVNLGWEPQYLMVKSTGINGWWMFDTSRGLPAAPGTVVPFLAANTSSAEVSFGANMGPTATGFAHDGNALGASVTHIYLAIRRPNKPPTTGTQVYNAIARTGTGAAATVTGVGFAPDLFTSLGRNNSSSPPLFMDRLRGSLPALQSSITNGEQKDASLLGRLEMDGVTLAADNIGYNNDTGRTYINHFFRRAVGVFDQVCFSGAGAAQNITHNLGVAPEFWIVKERTGFASGAWFVGSTNIANTERLGLNSVIAKTTDTGAWSSTYPTSTVLSLGTAPTISNSGSTYVAYLFATKAGISKVGSYTGNNGTQTIPCGFSTGARFILIKRTDSVGDWFVWDTARGIIEGNDNHLSLNTTAAEVTTNDSIDPDTSGFKVNQVAATNINVNSATYIFLAIS